MKAGHLLPGLLFCLALGVVTGGIQCWTRQNLKIALVVLTRRASCAKVGA